jgi:hypothetical protein
MARAPKELTVPPETPFFDDEDMNLEDPNVAEKIGDLADLDDPQFSEWEWTIYRLRTPDEMQRANTRNQRVWVAKATGPISLPDVQAQHGGGWYEFWGKENNVLKRKFRREIEGEKRIKTAVVPAPEMNGTPRVRRRSQTRRLMEMMLENQRRSDDRMMALLTAMVTRPHDPVPPAPQVPIPSITDLVGALGSLKNLTGKDGNQNAGELQIVKSVMDSFRQGLELGQTREPIESDGSDPNPILPVIDKGLDIFGRLIQQWAQRRPVPPGTPPRPSPSGATVVDPPPPPPPAPATSDPGEHRWRTAVSTVYRGMMNGRDPRDIAATLEDILDESEVQNLRGTPGAEPTVDHVLAYLAPLMADFPHLAGEQGRIYLGGVLAGLRAIEPEVVEAETVTE